MIIIIIITTIIIMTVRPSKIRVIINKQCLFNKIISAKPIAHFKKKNNISLSVNYTKFLQVFP